MHRLWLLSFGVFAQVGFLLTTSAITFAETIPHQGLIFSDKLGGFQLIEVTGSGTLEDPITVVERITGDRAIILEIRNFSREFGNRIGTQHVSAFAMKKVVINDSGHTWRNYQMELREVTTRHSPYGDGLSFGQNSYIGLNYTKSSFPKIQRFDEPEDTLGFSGTDVAPGEQAEFSFIISDMSPVSVFYLLQEPLQPLSQNNSPARWALSN